MKRYFAKVKNENGNWVYHRVCGTKSEFAYFRSYKRWKKNQTRETKLEIKNDHAP